jgi:WD40 repeat protein
MTETKSPLGQVILLLIKLFLGIAMVSASDASGEQAHLHLQMGHSGGVTSIAMSEDGLHLLTADADGTVLLWDSKTGREIRRLETHSGFVSSVAFFPASRNILTGGSDGSVRLWDLDSGRELRQFENRLAYGTTSISISPDRTLVLASGWHGALLWDAGSGKQLQFLGGLSATFSPDGQTIFLGSSHSGASTFWGIGSRRDIRILTEYRRPVRYVAFAKRADRLIVASGSGAAHVLDSVTGRELRSLGSDNIRCLALSDDGSYAVTGGDETDDSIARLWNVSTGQEIHKFIGHSGSINAVALSHDGHYVLTASNDRTARIWDLSTGKQVLLLTGDFDEVTSVAFSATDHNLLVGGDANGAQMWDLGAGRETGRFAGDLGPHLRVAMSHDGRMIVSGNPDRTVTLWDASSGKELRHFGAFSGRVNCLAFAQNDLAVFVGNGEAVQSIDVSTGREVQRYSGFAAPVYSVTSSPDGSKIVAGSSDGLALLWEISASDKPQAFEAHSGPIESTVFSPDGRLILIGTSDDSSLWDSTTGRELLRTNHRGSSGVGAFSPIGSYFSTVDNDGAIVLWDASKLQRVTEYRGDLNGVTSIAFSADGRRLLVGKKNGGLLLWDVTTRHLLATLASFLRGGWVVVDSEGRCDSFDPDTAPGLHFVAGDDVIEVGQLKQRFYTPGLLAKLWRGEGFPTIASSLRDVKLVPGVEVQAPAPGSVEATVRLTNRSGGIGKVIVKVNGRELPSATGGEAAQTDARTAEVKLNLEGATLSPTGKDVIEVFAENGDGVIRSRGEIATWEREPPKTIEPPKLFAIVVGVATYDNVSLNLRYAAKDAVDFGHALELGAIGMGGKERTRVTVLASGGGQEPTKENIRQAFNRVAKDARANDLLVVYLAGHGVAARKEQDQYYYLTKEARSTDIDRDAGLRAVSAVSSAELKEWLYLKNMPLKQVVILDTCAAGAAFGDIVKLADRRDLSPDQIRAIELLKDSTGSWILMGSAADAVSYEANRYAQGLLTYALLEGMHGAALEEDRVEVSKLFGFAQRQVGDLAKGIGGIQRPVLSAPKGQTFPIGLLKEEDRKQIHLATLKPQLLRVRVLDEDDLDSLKLESALRTELRAASLPVTRGSDRQDPQIVYLDSVVDEVPDGLIPQVRYSVVGDKVKIRLRLLQNGKPAAERNLELATGNLAHLTSALVPIILSESASIR